ncbi:hypothetical protein [Methanopyrus kandleri]
MLTEEELRRGAESATETIRPSGLAVTNRLVMLALMEVVGERGAAILFGAGRLLARELGDDLESTLTTFADITGCEVDADGDVVTVRNCPECAGYPGTRGPVCHLPDRWRT